MKVLIFSGSHTRHLYVNKIFKDLDIDHFAIVMEREDLIPLPPKNIIENDKINFIRHFSDREKAEKESYKDLEVENCFHPEKFKRISKDDLNKSVTIRKES